MSSDVTSTMPCQGANTSSCHMRLHSNSLHRNDQSHYTFTVKVVLVLRFMTPPPQKKAIRQNGSNKQDPLPQLQWCTKGGVVGAGKKRVPILEQGSKETWSQNPPLLSLTRCQHGTPAPGTCLFRKHSPSSFDLVSPSSWYSFFKGHPFLGRLQGFDGAWETPPDLSVLGAQWVSYQISNTFSAFFL